MPPIDAPHHSEPCASFRLHLPREPDRLPFSRHRSLTAEIAEHARRATELTVVVRRARAPRDPATAVFRRGRAPRDRATVEIAEHARRATELTAELAEHARAASVACCSARLDI